MISIDPQVRVYDKHGKPLPVLRVDHNRFDLTWSITLDVDLDGLAEYQREVNDAPTLDGVMRHWAKGKDK